VRQDRAGGLHFNDTRSGTAVVFELRAGTSELIEIEKILSWLCCWSGSNFRLILKRDIVSETGLSSGFSLILQPAGKMPPARHHKHAKALSWGQAR
jgi:hypothetical protein